MSFCPNINLPEWKTLEKEVGRFEAYRDFIETNGQIRSPKVVKKKLMMRDKGQASFQLERPGENLSAKAEVNVIKNLTARLAAKFDERAGFDYEYSPEARYKGKVIEKNGRPHIIINTAKATLDTPLHEFGHVFIAMLRMGNYRVYSALVERLERDKTFIAELEKTKELYADENLDPDELIEETIVQMLGMKASELVDQNEGSYNLIEEVWRAIVSFIKKMFQGDIDISFIDLNMIDRTDPLRNFAHMLASDRRLLLSASPDTQNALQNRDAEYARINEYYTKVLESMDSVIENSEDYGIIAPTMTMYIDDNYNNEYYMPIQIVKAETKQKIEKVAERMPTIMNDLRDQYRNPTWIDDFIVLADELRHSNLSREQKEMVLRTAETDKKFKKLFFVGKYQRNASAPSFNEVLFDYVLDPGFVGKQQLKNSYKNLIKNVGETLNEVHQDGVFNEYRFLEYISNSYDTRLRLLFDYIETDGAVFTAQQKLPEAYRQQSYSEQESWLGSYIQNDFSNKSVTDVMQEAKDTVTKEYNKFLTLKKDAIVRLRGDFVEVDAPVDRSTFTWEGVNPYTGEVIQDELEVTLSFRNNNTVGVAFSSKYARDTTGSGYGDALWIINIAKPEHNIPKGANIHFNGSYKSEGTSYLYSSDENNFYIRLTEKFENYLFEEDKINDFQNVFGVLKEVEEEMPDGTIKEVLELKLPKSRAHMIGFKATMNRGVAIMDSVMTEINRLSHFLPIKYISFSAAGSDYNEAKRSQSMRTGTYQMSAMRMFGSRYVAQKHNYTTGQNEFKTRDEIQAEYDLLTPDDLARLSSQYGVKKYRLIDYIQDNYRSQTIMIPEFVQGGFKVGTGKTLYQLEPGMGAANSASKANAEPTFKEDPSLEEIAIALDPASAEPVITEQKLKQAKATEFVHKLSSQLGVPADIITEEQAIEITKNTKNPWQGEAAFFLGGKIYFINGKLSTDLVMHEFGHPIVRQLLSDPDVRQAILNIYDTLRNTIEGREIIDKVEQLYPELEKESDRFIEEVVVKALEMDAVRKLSEEGNTPAFIKALKEILFQIKQFLRKVFGRDIPVSKLDSTTTLDQLSDILVKGGKIEMVTEVISDEQLAAYSREAANEVAQDLDRLENKEIQSTINTFYDLIIDHINMLQKNHNFDELADLLMDQYERGDLQQMRGNLTQWQSTVAKKTQEFLDEVAESRSRADALTNTLFRLQSVMDKIYSHTKEVSTRPDTQENMHTAYYYKHLVDHWKEFMDDFQKTLDRKSVV